MKVHGFQDAVLGYQDRSNQLYRAGGKRVFDVCFALLLLPVLAPVILVLGLVTKMIDGGTPFFGHLRVGKDGRMFRSWKIRTMCADAQVRLAAHLAQDPAAAAEWDLHHKLSNDPRVTRFGRFLRRTSLDELPQIWNVLISDMSFVGPRPVEDVELEKYGAWAGCYLSVRPGITGVWQISGRNALSYAQRVVIDRDYTLSIGLLRDLKLILLTVLVVLYATGK